MQNKHLASKVDSMQETIEGMASQQSVEEVQMQNKHLASKVDSMQETIEIMASQQEKLHSLLCALTKHSGIPVNEAEDSYTGIHSDSTGRRPTFPSSRPPFPGSQPPTPGPHSPSLCPPTQSLSSQRSQSPSPESGQSGTPPLDITEVPQL